MNVTGRPTVPCSGLAVIAAPELTYAAQKARAELESKGIEFGRDTLDSGVCHMAFFSDPDGNALMLHHRYAPKDAAPGSDEAKAAQPG